MGSFAFYFDKENSSKGIEVHFNLWNQCGWDETYLDIGVMFQNIQNDCKLNIRFPFEFGRNDVISLDEALNEADTLSIIFNESCVSRKENQSKWVFVSCGNEKKFYVYLMDITDANQFSLNKLENNTVATVNVPQLPNDDSKDIYIRFRVKISQYTSIIRSYDRPYKFIRGIFQKSYIIDFRYNDKRSFSENTIEKMEHDKIWANTNKIHFLLMSKASVNVECGDSVKKRMLEGNAWAKYLRREDISDDIIAYHAKARAGNDNSIVSWEFFAKQNVEIRDKCGIITFIAITIVIGIFCSVVSNPIYSFLCKLWDIIFRRCGT